MLTYLPETDKLILIIDMIGNEALQTSEIEGEYLNRDSIQSSIRRNFGLETEQQKIPLAERGIADMLVDLYKTYDRSLGHERMFREGPDGFKGGLSADNYLSLTAASRATATRDLQDLIAKGALVKTGELKGTRYHLAIEIPKELHSF